MKQLLKSVLPAALIAATNATCKSDEQRPFTHGKKELKEAADRISLLHAGSTSKEICDVALTTTKDVVSIFEDGNWTPTTQQERLQTKNLIQVWPPDQGLEVSDLYKVKGYSPLAGKLQCAGESDPKDDQQTLICRTSSGKLGIAPTTAIDFITADKKNSYPNAYSYVNFDPNNTPLLEGDFWAGIEDSNEKSGILEAEVGYIKDHTRYYLTAQCPEISIPEFNQLIDKAAASATEKFSPKTN